jgi:hypothetical protein
MCFKNPMVPSAAFLGGHRGGASFEPALGGPFDPSDVAVAHVVGWKRQQMVRIYKFLNTVLCSVITLTGWLS